VYFRSKYEMSSINCVNITHCNCHDLFLFSSILRYLVTKGYMVLKENWIKANIYQLILYIFAGICRCRALYEYKASQSDELDILPGDIITLTAKLDGGWWQGELHNKTGIFPASYVEEIGWPSPQHGLWIGTLVNEEITCRSFRCCRFAIFGKKKTHAHMPTHMLINEKKCFQVSLSVCYLEKENYCVLLCTIDLSRIAVNKLAASRGLGRQNTMICIFVWNCPLKPRNVRKVYP